MLKRSLFVLLILMLVMVLFIPAALADDSPAQPAEQQTTEPQVTDEPVAATASDDEAIPAEVKSIVIHQNLPDLGENADTSLGVSEDSVSAMSLPSTGPKKYTKTLTKQSITYEGIKYYYYTGYALYTDYIGGFRTFYSLTNQETDISYIDAYHTEPIKEDIADGPFSTWFNFTSYTQYAVIFYNWESPSVTYLMTAATEVDNTALKVSPNGYSKNWLQALLFYTDHKNYYIHITSPAGSTCSYDLFNVITYPNGDFNITDVLGEYKTITGDCYYFIAGNGKPYEIMMKLSNASSTTAAFTVALDSTEYRTAGISEGVSYRSNLKTNDTLTADFFIPAKTGAYKLTSSRSDSKITVMSETGQETGDYIVKNAVPGTVVNLEAGTKYFIYYTTNGTSGSINYSAVYVPSAGCSLLRIDSPFNLILNNRVVTATVENDVTSQQVSGIAVSDKATWALYSDKECSTETPKTDGTYTMSLSEGLNRAYIKVTAEDGIHYAVYPLYVYRSSSATEPAIIAYDSEYKEAGSGVFTNLNIYAFALGTSEVSANVSKDGETADWSDPFTAEGYYEINAFSSNGFGAGPFQFTIDKTAPVLTVVDGSGAAVASGALLKNTVTVGAADDTLTSGSATKDGAAYTYPEDGIFTESGVYAITVTDAAGNRSSYAFTIDVSAPYVRAVCSTKTLANGDHANGTVAVTVTDPHYKSKSVKKNGSSISWPSGGKFTYAGVYVVTAYDTLNNKTTFTFTIDKTKPSITAKYLNKYTLYDKGYTKYDVTVSVKDTYFDRKEATRDGAGYTWPEGNKFTEQGKYIVKAYDKAGNTASFTFTIDKTLPTITAVTEEGVISSGACVNERWLRVYYNDDNYPSKSVKRNGYSMTWPSGGTFTLQGSYVVTVKDRAGNVSTFSFIIDYTPPAVSVKTASGVTVHYDDTTKYSVYVKVSDLNYASKVANIRFPESTFEHIDWPSNNMFTQEGIYEILARDKAPNLTAYYFTIDKPARFIVAEKNTGDPVVNNGYANDEVTISFDEKFYVSKTLTKKGSSVPIPWPDDPKEITVSDEGVYTATVKDTIGNTSVFTFTIDKTAPVITAKAYSGAVVGNGDPCRESRVTVYINEKNFASKTAMKDNKKISWPSYSRFTYEGVYKITAVDKAGNKTEFTFIIDRSKPVITCKTVTSQTKIANGATVSDSVTIAITDRAGVTNTLKKDGVDIAWLDTVTENGVYGITSTDVMGYKNTFMFTIQKTS